MEIEDRYGLAVAHIGPAELGDEPWLRTDRHVDVVRLPDPPAALWDELAARGFVRKPALLTWVAELGPDEDTYLADLDRTARKSVRRARRHAAEAGLREVVEDPVTPAALDRFLALYKERVAEMRYGVPFALDYRDAVLHGPRKFFGVFAYEHGAGNGGPDGELVGGTLVLECPAAGALVLRFSAVSERWRTSSLARSLYLAAMREGRERGYERATLGNEPNLLGHLTRPGLLRFKAGLGFRAVPSHEFGDPHPGDEADLVLRLDALSDPALILGYAGGDPAAPGRLAGRLISRTAVDPAPYAAPFLESVTVQAPALTGTGGGGPAEGGVLTTPA
ncbi:GNAT family N-acetyltransferase [Streptomyces armeniacus]|uniref:GNAT family N-acetyltransferase n=1 Tax=Streptomyces armeniacus TaxID=83291 RepID=A0A345XJU7_9ACTN|nr:GNAT family N-acetyltransferase [Streptomyces armeniacus]AXK31913.1 GNAT family N-acetyltransferase [Streptomyces armeniacus]